MSNKKKIGIVTITNDGYNFGNRLQNYALQTVLERMGFDVETLNRPIKNNQRDWRQYKKSFIHWLIPYRTTIQHLKSVNFYLWNTCYIHWSKTLATDANLPELANQYDYFIAGSDQIWNPKFQWGLDPYMYLQFIHPTKRIAYAASIGIDAFDDGLQQDICKQYWQNWKAISVRETSGAQIIKESINKEVPVLLDPTLLLSADDWKKLTKYCNTPDNYILVYTLGQQTDEYKQYINNLASKMKCIIVDVMNDIHFAGCSPSRFVALIQHAKWIITDSYHAIVFSIIFHKKFSVLQRIGRNSLDMSSRISTLLSSKLNLYYLKKQGINEYTNYCGHTDGLITIEQENTYNFLKQQLIQ